MPIFSRRHYRAVAETIRDMYLHDPAIRYDTAGLIMSRFTLMFKRDNPRFRASRFEEACGLAEWTDKHKEAADVSHDADPYAEFRMDAADVGDA